MIADSISQGYNATIFAYGMTGAGKSYTMFGDLYNNHRYLGMIWRLISTPNRRE